MTSTARSPVGHIPFSSPSGRRVVLGMVLGSGVVSLDATVVNVALVRLAEDLDAGFAELQWVVNGYTLTLASLMLIGGALGDRIGRRRMFLVGLVWFMAASALCGLAPNSGLLVAARALQGIGGALLTPGSLAILQASFRPEDRARAIGAWSGYAGVTTAIGPFVGGYLVESASWRWVFLINLPLGAVAFWVTVRHVPESRDPAVARPLDVSGALAGTLGLVGVTWGLIERSWIISLLGAAALVVFVVVERRRDAPMLPFAIFRSRQFSSTNVATLCVYAGVGAALFMIALVLQSAMGYSPLEAGASLIPITVIMLLFSSWSGSLAQRIGPRWQMTLGPLAMAGGLLLMTQVGPGATYGAHVLPAVVVFGAGLAATVAPLTATVLAAADEQHAGIASGVNNAVARVGGLLAVAAIPLVAGISPTGAIAPSVLVDGFHTVAVAAATLVAAGGLVAWRGVRRTVLSAATPDNPIRLDQRPSSFHCGADAPPLSAAPAARPAARST